METSFGTIKSPMGLYLRTHVGDAEYQGIKIELSLANNNTPLVLCHTTNKSFMLTWHDIIRMAVNAGLLQVEE